MTLRQAYKSTGWIVHWVPDNTRTALCGTRPKRGFWRKYDRAQPKSTHCAVCAKIKAAQEGLEKLGLRPLGNIN